MAVADGFTDVASARRRSRRAAVATIAAVAAVVVVAVAATVVRESGSSSTRLRAVHVTPQPGDVTVTQLSAYHWSTLPDAPIANRAYGTVGVWTGDRMIVWGGEESHSYTTDADGASYDPDTRTWQRLPDAPLGPRNAPAYVWTGHVLFVWGGHDGEKDLADGATYDPAADTWHRVPPVDVGGHSLAMAVWTGSQVVLFTAAGLGTAVDVHAYDPSTDDWSTLPAIRITQTNLLAIDPLVAGDQLFVWLPVQTVSNGLRPSDDGFVYRRSTNSWESTDVMPAPSPYSVGDATWTGDHVLFAPNGLLCTCGGLAGVSTGSWADPANASVRPIPSWDAEQRGGPPTFRWTGAAVLAVNFDRAAAWDPISNRWTELAGLPYQYGAVQLWTGNRLLVWGQLSARDRGPNAGSPPEVAEPTGLEFAP